MARKDSSSSSQEQRALSDDDSNHNLEPLASAGLLDGKRATTHWAALDELRAFKGVSVEHRRYIRQGNIITSGGVVAGIDVSLYVVGMLYGAALKSQTAKQMEYRSQVPSR
jgi:transcriptional regulator GlxA family with amidase domain